MIEFHINGDISLVWKRHHKWDFHFQDHEINEIVAFVHAVGSGHSPDSQLQLTPPAFTREETKGTSLLVDFQSSRDASALPECLQGSD